MQITRQTEYAIRTLLELARAPEGEVLSTKFISTRQDIPEDFLKKTLKLMVLADLVTTQRGAHGGIRLIKPADEITLLDVITAIEGPIALNVCLVPGYKCPNQPDCAVSAALARAQKALTAELAKVTLVDLVTKAK
mgnify:CR=1 FL=1